MENTEPSASPSAPSTSTSDEHEHRSNDSRYDCNICLDCAKDAVISMCGHLFWSEKVMKKSLCHFDLSFSWPCIHQWLETRPARPTCPVCKSALSADKLIPLYGRGGDGVDPRKKVPPRPQGQRSEPQGGVSLSALVLECTNRLIIGPRRFQLARGWRAVLVWHWRLPVHFHYFVI